MAQLRRGALVIEQPSDSRNLRAILREATAHTHDQLDEAMRAATGWTTTAHYAAFLSLQHAARRPVEDWLDAHAPEGLCPPPQSPLIATDLAALRVELPAKASNFELNIAGPHAKASILGVAWVLAGSSLGNRAILHELRRNGHEDWPSAFLGDDAMLAFWNAMRPGIEAPTSAEAANAATEAAQATFAHFIAVAKPPSGTNPDQDSDVPTCDPETPPILDDAATDDTLIPSEDSESRQAGATPKTTKEPV